MHTGRHLVNLALIGFMGTGKTSAGRLVAEQLHFEFIDTDELIQTRTGRTIADIFARNGEATFRALERDVVTELANRSKTVISTGGGLPTNPENLAALKQHALVVCLWASPEKIWERVRNQSHRPLLHDPDPQLKIKELLKLRGPFYQQADVLINTDGRSAREVAQQIVLQYKLATRLVPMKTAIRQRAAEIGFDDCRFTTAAAPASAEQFQRWLGQKNHGEMNWLERNAEKRVNPQNVLPGAKSVIVLAASYEPSSSSRREEALNEHAATGVIARYACYADYHDVLGERLKTLTAFVNDLGGAPTRSLWYVDTGPLLERDLAQRAGLGFVGKHTNVISRRLGNWIFLAEILTTLELEPDAPETNHCGKCIRCIAACPTNAITAPFQLDARKCISYLTIELKGAIPLELRPAIGNRIFGCDDCLAVCPWNRFAREGRLMQTHARADLHAPDLIELLQLDEAAFKARFAGTPILRTKRRGLLRNVCVALGNVGDGSALPALEKAVREPEPLIAEHARWAMEQITARQ